MVAEEFWRWVLWRSFGVHEPPGRSRRLHPRQVQQVLYANVNRGRVKEILKRGRQLAVDGVALEGFLFDETAEVMESEAQNLPDLDSLMGSRHPQRLMAGCAGRLSSGDAVRRPGADPSADGG